MNTKHKWIFTYASLGVLFLLIVILFYHFPPTGDDWVLMQPKSFSLSEILTKVARDLARQNGRVLGNLMGELFTYSVPRYLLKVIFLITMLSHTKSNRIRSSIVCTICTHRHLDTADRDLS